MLTGDDAPTAYFKVGEPSDSHLGVEEVAGEPGDRRDFVHGVSERLGKLPAALLGHRILRSTFVGRMSNRGSPAVACRTQPDLAGFFVYLALRAMSSRWSS